MFSSSRRPHRLVFLTALLATALVACADEEPTDHDHDHDAGHDTADAATHHDTTPDAEEPDAAAPDTGAPDAPSAVAGTDAVADAAVPDVGADATPDATVDDAAPCDPAAVAAEALGLVDAVTEGVVSATEDDGVWTATVDASAGGIGGSSSQPWVYLDLDTGTRVDLTDVEALASDAWDVALKRANIRLNGGDSGPGPWLVTRVDGTAFDDLVQPPGRDAEWASDDFVTDDCELIADGRGAPVTAFGQWYDYDPATHGVAPTPDTTFVLYHAATHAVFRLGIDTWDNGVFGLRWASM